MIESKKELKLENLFTNRIKINRFETENYIQALKKRCQDNEIYVQRLITVTFGIENKSDENQIFDLELIIEPKNTDLITHLPNGFLKKTEIYITNALYLHYQGSNKESIKAFSEINNYLISNKLLAITPAYSVSNNPFNQPDGEIDLEIYIGINPNIL